MAGDDLLVPVDDSVTLRKTVAYVAERAADADGRPTLHFVYPVSERIDTSEEGSEATAAADLLDRIEVWVEEDLGEDADSVAVATAVVGRTEYLFNPGDYADVLADYARRHGVGTVVLDPEYNPLGMAPLLPPLEGELESAGLTVELAPVERPTRRSPLTRTAGLGQFVVLFCATYGFYLLVSGTLATFDLATGAITAGVVSALLWRITTRGEVEVSKLGGRLARFALYVPFLLWEIVKANLDIAYVVLHPRLPIDPRVVEFDAAVWSALPATTLANSITLTPGTLTIDVTQRHFTVHSLTAGARDDLLDGALERAVRFVFYGRRAARIASPTERGARTDDETEGENA
ncbi:MULTISPECIES: monovalent cation/H+ antiporter subunit E [unclassified Halobacterium]|uniref:Monovalent cation/H+ antiporter subunit E n=1 Tax=Halobacterium sp. NMX12-1 TaxID=3166650 RepID=A0AAU8C8V3_9EURY|nr:monovalent cation/H+ antiporter subunit E [Halobacterium sp. KA-6]MCD2202297.1 monovalent cation/H+ antiporter subunit E [Halobacterium sp. KA-6]